VDSLLSTTFHDFMKAFTPSISMHGVKKSHSSKLPAVIADGVEFDTIAREWRCKWSGDNDKKSLVELQKVLDEYLPTVKAIDGVKSVERIVCGGCLDFKVITSLEEGKFGAWAETEFQPEADVLKALETIDGVSVIETQTYTVCFYMKTKEERYLPKKGGRSNFNISNDILTKSSFFVSQKMPV
jgi:hypothetical protein